MSAENTSNLVAVNITNIANLHGPAIVDRIGVRMRTTCMHAQLLVLIFENHNSKWIHTP